MGSAQIAAEEANIPIHRVVEHNFSLAGNQLDPDLNFVAPLKWSPRAAFRSPAYISPPLFSRQQVRNLTSLTVSLTEDLLEPLVLFNSSKEALVDRDLEGMREPVSPGSTLLHLHAPLRGVTTACTEGFLRCSLASQLTGKCNRDVHDYRETDA